MGRTARTKSYMVDTNEDELGRLVIISTRPDGIITSSNSAADRFYGVSADTVVGKVALPAFHDPIELVCRRKALLTQSGTVIANLLGVIVAQVGIGQMVEEE